MSITPDCTKCVFVMKFIPKGEILPGFTCKRFPPAPVAIGVDPVRGPMISATHPIVGAGQWCHEFRPAEDAKPVTGTFS